MKDKELNIIDLKILHLQKQVDRQRERTDALLNHLGLETTHRDQRPPFEVRKKGAINAES